MKIIFLDFDGCIRCAGSYLLPSYVAGQGKPAPAHPDCVAALNFIIAETGARIVVSSVWRVGGVGKMRDVLAEWGVRGECLGVTPDLSRRGATPGEHVARGVEIQRWLDAQSGRGAVESFVILDDDDDMLHLAPRLVRTEFELGLTMEHARRAVRLLQEPTDAGGAWPLR